AEPYVLGRHASCRFTFDDPVISNRHFSIIRVCISPFNCNE
ncbi:FHA domain-containing protein, partial [Acinetobacter baumannii]|nr:FHA domain-containing protein [Acinetobacter baumannii]